ncbi:MAG: tetratricopeptide repeat protein [Deltaproteobacteria bacterium]|nr:tetratricopeptide repeat protein [Deltaproteobacteria bacterium]
MIGKNYAKMLRLLVLLLWISVSGCAAFMSPSVEKSQEVMTAPSVKKPVSPEKQGNPREIASLQLTDQGRILLEQGKADEAITVLERALNLYPTNGRNYYYLSEAWLLKNDVLQAKEWNRLAELYLSDDKDWLKKVHDQKSRIRKLFR